MKTAVKKYGPLLTALLLHGAALLLAPRAEKEALSFCGQNLLNFFLVLPPVFLCVGLMDAWVSRDRMMRTLGENSGVKGRCSPWRQAWPPPSLSMRCCRWPGCF